MIFPANETSIYKEFSMAMLNNQIVYIYIKQWDSEICNI